MLYDMLYGGGDMLYDMLYGGGDMLYDVLCGCGDMLYDCYMGAIQTIPFNLGAVLPSQPRGVRDDKPN